MARTLQSLINATQGTGAPKRVPKPNEVTPYADPVVHGDPYDGARQQIGGGMPLGTPQLSQGALQGEPSPFTPLAGGPPPRVAGTPVADSMRGPVSAYAPTPFDAYGGAFGGVNRNDLYRKDSVPERGPNGSMNPAPNFDFNAMAGSQNSGEGAALRADAPWRGVFADQWLTSTPDEYRRLAAAGNQKDPRTGRPRSETNMFGAAPRDVNGNLLAPQEYNPDTGVSTGFGPGRDPVSGAYIQKHRDEDGDWNSGSDLGDQYTGLTDGRIKKYLEFDGDPKILAGMGYTKEKLEAEKAHREAARRGATRKK